MKSVRLICFGASACVALSGCRVGYEILSDDGSVSMGEGGAGPGGNSAGGSIVGGGGAESGTGGRGSGGEPNTGGGPTLGGPFVVTSSQDPSEAGKVTLRNAILSSNAAAGDKTITFAPGLGVIEMNDVAPPVTENVTIQGEGQEVDFARLSGSANCFVVEGGSFRLEQVQIKNCPNRPLRIEGGTDHVIIGSNFTENGGPLQVVGTVGSVNIGPGNLFQGGDTYGILLNDGSNVVSGNTFIESGGTNDAAVGLFGNADGTFVIGNLMVRSVIGVLVGTAVDSTKIWHNTIVGSTSDGFALSQGVNVDVRNNIITHTANRAVDYGPGVTNFDHNLYFANGAHCNGCPSGLGANSKIEDPLYVNFAEDDFRLQAASNAIDAGDAGVPMDRNGGDAGTFNGVDPDIGYFETNF